MAIKLYFAFHQQNDACRVQKLLRECSATLKDHNARVAGLYDASAWRDAEKTGALAVKRMIKMELVESDVTVFLLGAKTFKRRWVIYELHKSWEWESGIIGVYIHQIENRRGKTSKKGKNILNCFTVKREGKKIAMDDLYPTYDWVTDDGKNNFWTWVEDAAIKAGKQT